VKSFEEAESLAYEESFDVWIFDVKIIGGNGFELLENLRNSQKLTPCIFTTSLNSINDLKKGFLSGCDDYLKKPFELAELKLRVDNLVKRQFAHKLSTTTKLGDGLEFDINQKILLKDGENIKLPAKESKLLALLLQNRNKFVTKDEIYNTVWEYDEVPSELSLRVYIRNLRKYFGEKIVSRSKVGYAFIE
ncbi:MAG: response regulator transcription factor, partial [Campylobacter sp.]|nr:response regulator transcription factor [Campylobacter sp.]